MLYSTREAAEYLGVAFSTIKYFIYTKKTLHPLRMIGRSLVFTQKQLDDFQANRRKPGRPSKDEAIS